MSAVFSSSSADCFLHAANDAAMRPTAAKTRTVIQLLRAVKGVRVRVQRYKVPKKRSKCKIAVEVEDDPESGSSVRFRTPHDRREESVGARDVRQELDGERGGSDPDPLVLQDLRGGGKMEIGM